MGSFLDFKQIHDTGKTKVYQVLSKNGDLLAKINWFPAWRKYTFFPELGTIFDAKCLLEIVDFLNKIMEDRKYGSR